MLRLQKKKPAVIKDKYEPLLSPKSEKEESKKARDGMTATPVTVSPHDVSKIPAAITVAKPSETPERPSFSMADFDYGSRPMHMHAGVPFTPFFARRPEAIILSYLEPDMLIELTSRDDEDESTIKQLCYKRPSEYLIIPTYQNLLKNLFYIVKTFFKEVTIEQGITTNTASHYQSVYANLCNKVRHLLSNAIEKYDPTSNISIIDFVRHFCYKNTEADALANKILSEHPEKSDLVLSLLLNGAMLDKKTIYKIIDQFDETKFTGALPSLQSCLIHFCYKNEMAAKDVLHSILDSPAKSHFIRIFIDHGVFVSCRSLMDAMMFQLPFDVIDKICGRVGKLETYSSTNHENISPIFFAVHHHDIRVINRLKEHYDQHAIDCNEAADAALCLLSPANAICAPISFVGISSSEIKSKMTYTYDASSNEKIDRILDIFQPNSIGEIRFLTHLLNKFVTITEPAGWQACLAVYNKYITAPYLISKKRGASGYFSAKTPKIQFTEHAQKTIYKYFSSYEILKQQLQTQDVAAGYLKEMNAALDSPIFAMKSKENGMAVDYLSLLAKRLTELREFFKDTSLFYQRR